MTKEEAKEFYQSYLGYSFHMGREEPAKYESFRRLGIGEDVLREWDEELLEEQFGELLNEPGRVWTHHENIIRIMNRGRCDTERYLERLLDGMQQMEDLGPDELTLVIENMAGRTESGRDGGAYLFRAHPELQKRMREVMQHIIAVRSAFPDMDGRAERAIRRYKTAE